MQRSSLDILLFLSSMGPTIKIRIPITTHKANEKIDGITAYFAISKTILKTIPDNTVFPNALHLQMLLAMKKKSKTEFHI